MRVQIDSLVRGRYGSTDREGTMRVFRVSSFGWLAGIGVDDGKQHTMHPGRFDVVEGPRPMNQRRDIPDRLR